VAALVTDLGLANITAAWVAYTSRIRYLQWGTGSGQTNSSTDLANKAGTSEQRQVGVTTQQTDATANDTFQIIGTITSLGTKAITEVGAFDDPGAGSPPSGGNMGFYADFGVVTLAQDDAIEFHILVTFDQA
jgi:hypothetical protein